MKFDFTITLAMIAQTLMILGAFGWGAIKLYIEFREMRLEQREIDRKVRALWRIFVGDDDEPGLEQRIHHAVRGAINDDAIIKELARRVRDYL